MSQIDYVGFKTEAFEVIEKVDGGKWKVRCRKCGKEYIRDIRSIKNFKSSGCTQCTPRIAKSKPNDWHMYVHYRGHAREKNREFLLSYEEFQKLCHSNCYYCGSEPEIRQQFIRYSKNTELQPLNGIDRIDSSKGYTLDNCVPCCMRCNQMKSDMNVSDFIDHVDKIYNYLYVQRLSREGVESSDSKNGDS